MEAHLRQAALERARKGDAQALYDLLDSFRPYAELCACAFLRSEGLEARGEDHDLGQEGLREAERLFPEFAGGTLCEFAAWLRGILAATVSQAARTRQDPSRIPASDSQQAPESATPLADPANSPSVRMQRITDGLASLSLEAQQVLLGCHMDGLPHEAIAVRLGWPQATVRGLYIQGTCQLRDFIRASGAAQPPHAEDRHGRLAELFDEVLAGLRSGSALDASALAVRHAGLDGEVPALLQTLTDTDAVLKEWRTSSFPTSSNSCFTPSKDENARGHEGASVLPASVGRYQILALIGAGGMGKVYKAHDPKLNRIVAVKVPRRDVDREDWAGWVRRFLREAQSAAQIRHPHVCPIYDFGEHDRVPYVVMAYIDGPSLYQCLEGPHNYSDPREAARLVRQMAEALEAIHAHGLVHRDLKPANVLIDRNGQAILTDFGLARLEQDAERLTAEDGLVGTPAFMAPEQTDGDTNLVSYRADIYSLGVVLYRLLTGRLPFLGRATAVLWKIGHERPPLPSALRPSLDSELEAVVLKAMAVLPEDRYQSARQFAEALDAWLALGIGTSLPPAVAEPEVAHSSAAVTQEYRTPQPIIPETDAPAPAPAVRRNGRRFRTALAAALLLLLLASGGFLADQMFRADSQEQPNRGGTDPKGNPPGGADPTPRLGPAAIRPEPLVLPAGAPLSPKALVLSPANLDGARSWTVETREHRGPVHALAHSPDSSRLAAAGDDGMVRIWENGTRKLLRVLMAHAGPIRGLAWAPRGKFLASASDDGTVRLWDADSGLLLRTLREQPGNTRAVAWSSDGETLAAAGTDGVVRLWKTADGGLLPAVFRHDWPLYTLAWSPDGKSLAAAGAGPAVCLWEVSSGQKLHALEGHEFPLILALRWSPDGKTLASAGQDGRICLWNRASRKPGSVCAVQKPVIGLAWSPAGDALCSGTVNGVQTWDTSGKLLRTLGKHNRAIFALSWSPDGNSIAWAGEDLEVRLWDTAKPAMTSILGHPAGAAGVAWSPNGKTLALTGFGDGALRLWDANTGAFRLLTPVQGSWHRPATWSPDGKVLATSSRTGLVHLWSMPEGQTQGWFQEHTSEVLCLAWSPSGKTLASGSADGALRLLDPPTGKSRLLLKGQPGGVFAVCWCPDGETLACGTTRDVQILRAAGGKTIQVLEKDTGPTQAVAWSPRGTALATADGMLAGKVQFWKAGAWELTRNVAGHDNGVFACAWSGDGTVLATGGADSAVRCLYAETGQLLIAVEGHTAAVRSLSWRGKTRTLASASEDGRVRIGGIKTRKPEVLLVPLRDGRGLAVSADGHVILPPNDADCAVVVVQTALGQDTLTLVEFSKKYQWKNDPKRPRLSDD